MNNFKCICCYYDADMGIQVLNKWISTSAIQAVPFELLERENQSLIE